MTQQLTEAQIKALLAHLSDYIQLMDITWPNQEDAVKSRARALLIELTGESL